MPLLKSDQFDASIRAGKIGTVYLFDGPEVWLKERAVHAIIAKLLPKDARDFNLERFHGSSASAGDVLSAAQSLPFLSERRVVIVEEAEEFSSSESGVIADAIAELPESTCLVMSYAGKASPRDPLTAAVLSHGNLVTFWTPFPNQMPRWIQEEARRRGKPMDSAAAQALADSCQDLQQVSNELDKLMLFVGKKTSISYNDLMDFGLPDDSGDQKDLEAALCERRLDQALRHCHLLQEQGIRPEAIFPTIDRLFRQLYLAGFYVREKRMSLEEAIGELGIRAITQKRNFEAGYKAYSPSEVESAFSKIAEADFQMKTGLLSGEMSMSLLVLSLVGSSSPRRMGDPRY